MLSEYFIFLFLFYEITVLYFIVRIRARNEELLLWVPVLTTGLISLSEPVCRFLIANGFVTDPDSPIFLFLNQIISQWNRYIVAAFLFCIALSASAWYLCRQKRHKSVTWLQAAKALAILFLCGTIVCAAARHFNFPYVMNRIENESWVSEENGVPYYHYTAYGDAVYVDGLWGRTNAALPIYESPDDTSAVISTIPADQKIYLSDLLHFCYATQIRNWRYVIIRGEYNFPEQAGVRGYIRLSDALHCFSVGQGSWLYNAFGRYQLLAEDQAAYENGKYMTPDYSQLYLPLGLRLSAVLFLFSAFAAIFFRFAPRKLKNV